jgi:hypothetical protein
VASVKGWKVVVKKDDYKVGDLAVYYEIDSFLPIRPQFEFLRKSSFKRIGSIEGFRLKTIKLRGQLSQGLLTPIPDGILDPKEGDDLTEALDIVKYEPPIPAQLAGKIKGTFPSFIPKTDEIRIQNFETDVGFVPVGERVYVTEKLDGCLHEDTLIKTEHGDKTIKEIVHSKYEGNVYSYNVNTNKLELKPILNHFNNGDSDNWYELEFENGETLKVTGNHQIWIPNINQYKRVDELVLIDDNVLHF